MVVATVACGTAPPVVQPQPCRDLRVTGLLADSSPGALGLHLEALGLRAGEAALLAAMVRGAVPPRPAGAGPRAALVTAWDGAGRVRSVAAAGGDLADVARAVRRGLAGAAGARWLLIEWPAAAGGASWAFGGTGDAWWLPADLLAVHAPAADHRPVAARLRRAGRPWSALARCADGPARPVPTASVLLDGLRPVRRRDAHVRGAPLAVAALLASARAGADYLRRATGGQGRFVYRLRADTGAARSGYNIVRHAGTTYAMLEVAGATGQPGLVAAAERALAHLLDHTVRLADDTDLLAHDGEVKLGGVALAVLALTEHVRVTGRREHLAAAQRLGRYLLASQDARGDFVHKRHYPSLDVDPFRSRYYPGEAVFALARLYEIDGDVRWLNAAEAGADHLIDVRDRGVPPERLDHDHWLLYGLDLLDRHRPDRGRREHALRIARAILAAEARDAAGAPTGVFDGTLSAGPQATRLEGLAAASRLARRNGRDRLARQIEDALRRGAAQLMSLQLGPERAMFTARPAVVLGGFVADPERLEIRIDTVQHAISALLAIARLGDG